MSWDEYINQESAKIFAKQRARELAEREDEIRKAVDAFILGNCDTIPVRFDLEHSEWEKILVRVRGKP